MALLTIGTEHVARWANRNGVVQWKSGDPVHFLSIQVGLQDCPSAQGQLDRIPPLTALFRESHFHLFRISGYIVSTDAFCALSGRRLY